MSVEHKPVLGGEAIEALNIKPDAVYIDGTFGRGGHAKQILARLGMRGRLFALDKDEEAITYAEGALHQDLRFTIEQGSFAMLEQYAKQWGVVGKVEGVLLDVGVSSPQLDTPARGFSFQHDGPLDMRMNPNSGVSAAQWLATASVEAMADVIKRYGEERYAKRIARAIVKTRETSPIITTAQLAAVVARANPGKEKGKNPATRTFQAIRIFINNELDDLQACLAQVLTVLKPGGRLAVISFHSLEDRIVKQFIAKHVRGDDFPIDFPLMADQLRPQLCQVGKSVTPGDIELYQNPRSRSARLRVAEKLRHG